jgi:hypothetical protein
MYATTVRQIDSRLPATLPGVSATSDYRAIQALLQPTLKEVDAQGLYLHRLDQETARARLVASAGVPATESTALAREHLTRKTPTVLQEGSWRDARFARFPEFLAHRFEGVVSIPVSELNITTGILNVCRRSSLPLKATTLTRLLDLAVPLGALLSAAENNTALRTEVDRLQRQLADRKVIERAKGLLQSHLRLTEEEAYFYLRSNARRRRTAMRELAVEVIQKRGPQLTEEAFHAE